MSKLIYPFMILVYMGILSFIINNEIYCKATWYDTKNHPKVHRNHSTAAISRNLIMGLNITVGRKNNEDKGTMIVVTNLSNSKTDTVEVTDVCGSTNHIDLSLQSFEKISKKSVGVIKVKVKKL
jgi:hypothetical protein